MPPKNRGPLVLVEIRPGRFAKMYEKGAAERGLLPKNEALLEPVPMMDPPEIKALNKILKEKQPARVLEWGSGGSTLYWPKLYSKIDWVSLEHNKQYADEVRQKMPSNVTLIHESYPKYYQAHKELGTFDLIIVDGRHRVECLSAAREMLAEGGIVLLHDAGRERYHKAKEFYKNLEELVPPKKSRDPRGLWLFSEPVRRDKE